MKIEEGKSYITRNGNITRPMERPKNPISPYWPWTDPATGNTYTDSGSLITDHGSKTPFDLIALNESDPEESHEVTREDIKEQLADALRPSMPETTLPDVGMVTVSTSEYLEIQNLIKLQKQKIDLLTERIEFIKKHLS